MRQVRGRDIGMIFQEPMTSLNPVLTVGRQLTEPVEIHLGMTPAQSRARGPSSCSTLVGISDAERRLRQYPHQFSGGMRQRMMIAMALSCNPALILADEPTTALDVTIQAQILELMKGLSRRLGAAMLMITHNLGVVARYADRVNVMYAGKIVERATARELYANPRHPYTLGLLHSVPRLDEPRRAKLDPIPGQPPDLSRLPGGCSFAPRCPYVIERCRADVPPLDLVGAEHLSGVLGGERARQGGFPHERRADPRGARSRQAFRGRRRPVRRSARPGQGGRRRQLRHSPGRDPRARGRVRLRQDDHGALHPPARAADQRSGDLRGRRSDDARASRAAGRCGGGSRSSSRTRTARSTRG